MSNLQHLDGRACCTVAGCDWWVPAGMEYLYDDHMRKEHRDNE